MRRRKVSPIRIIAPAAALAILLAACGSSGSTTKTAATSSTAPATTAAAFTVGTATDPKLGVVLVDGQGRTL